MSWHSGHIHTALVTIRANRGRSLITMFGIIVGVAGLIVVVGISQGVKNEITNQVNAYSNNVISVTSKAATLNSFGVSSVPAVSTLTNQDVRAISKIKGIVVVPLSIMSGVATGEQSDSNGIVIATSGQLLKVLNQTLVYGSFFSGSDTNPFTAVLGSTAAHNLYKKNIPLGFGLNWRGQQFIVDGVMNSFQVTPFSSNSIYNNAIFINQNAIKQMNLGGSSIYKILVRVNKGSQLTKVDREINTILLKTHDGDNNFSVLMPSQEAQSNTSVFNLLTELTISIAVIALFVGGVGIMNVMLVSVAERMHEIGIRKAIGASNRQIMSQFMIEATTVSVVGGLIGIIIALIIELGLRLTTNLVPTISWEIIVLSAVISSLIGIIFGSIPALRAASKQPIDALRND